MDWYAVNLKLQGLCDYLSEHVPSHFVTTQISINASKNALMSEGNYIEIIKRYKERKKDLQKIIGKSISSIKEENGKELSENLSLLPLDLTRFIINDPNLKEHKEDIVNYLKSYFESKNKKKGDLNFKRNTLKR